MGGEGRGGEEGTRPLSEESHSARADTDEEEEDGEEDAIMEHREIEHPGGVNRVRVSRMRRIPLPSPPSTRLLAAQSAL